MFVVNQDNKEESVKLVYLVIQVAQVFLVKMDVPVNHVFPAIRVNLVKKVDPVMVFQAQWVQRETRASADSQVKMAVLVLLDRKDLVVRQVLLVNRV